MTAIVCSFTSLDDLKPKDRRDTAAVLRVLGKAGRFSVFEATAHRSLALTLDRVFEEKLVRRTGGEFPWTEVELTDEGKALLETP